MTLWPAEAGSDVEAFEQDIKRYLGRAAPNGLSVAQLRNKCHVNDGGNGGEEAFMRAINSLKKTDVICYHFDANNNPLKTRKGNFIFFLADEGE